MIEAVFRTVTPLFLGGADGKKAEIRAASIKGALRFWYRAVSFRAGTEIKDVRKSEAEIFGSSDGGQSSFLLDVVEKDIEVIKPGYKWGNQGVSYLGYGLLDYKGIQKERESIRPGGSFRVRFLLRRDKEKTKASLLQTLKALNLFGGLGSRSRRGFGSVNLETLTVDGAQKVRPLVDVKELADEIEDFQQNLGGLATDLPPYTAISSRARVVLGPIRRRPLDVLENIGREMIRYRSYGRSGDSGEHVLPWGEIAQQNFSGDHDLIKDFALTGTAHKHPERVIFGLPHNYFFAGTTVNIEGESEDYQRRASPLFIHIHKLEEGYIPVLTLLPAVFLPKDAQLKLIKIQNKRIQNEDLVSSGVKEGGYKALNDFLDRIPGRQEVKLL